MKPLLHYIWPIFLALMLTSTGLAVWQFLHQDTSSQGTPNPLHLSPALAAQNRQCLLAKVRTVWIKGVLENSLHGAALMVLGLQEQPNAVAHPWQLVLQEADQSTRPLPQGTRITQVYDEAVGELLILGEPGAGKTTLLLELARDLLDRAGKDSSLPMPIVFNLSSWAVKQQPLVEWLIDEMNTKYLVPCHLGRAWIATDQILLLLDGLDEVKKEYRPACVGAINTFRLQHGLVPMVVCSRKAEYLDLTTRVLLQSAVVIQPLSEKQIDAYLSNADKQLEVVRVALRDDQALKELATTPLMLSVLTLAYVGKTGEELEMTGSPETRRQHVFATYVERMLQRREDQAHYTHEQTKHWLAWLARQRMRQNQTEFYIEQIQPTWLPDNKSRRAYYAVMGITVGLIFGGIVGLTFIISELTYGLTTSLNLGLVMGGFFGLFAGLFASGILSIRTRNYITWSLENVRRNFFIIRVCLIGGFVFGLITSSSSFSFAFAMRNVIACGLVSALLSTVIIGLLPKGIDQQNVIPNKVMRRSLQNGIIVGLFVGLLSGGIFGLLIAPEIGLIFGVILGLIFVMSYGAGASIQHFVLQWFLQIAGAIAWNYVQFLDYAADRLLLRKVGGGYIFIHRLLIEYFASLPLPQSLVNGVQTQPAASAQDRPTPPTDDAQTNVTP